MNLAQCKDILMKSARGLSDQVDRFSAIDAETGDGDHGVAISAIMNALIQTLESSCAKNLGGLFSEISAAIMETNGGSSVALWGMMADGISETAGQAEETDACLIQKMFEAAVEAVETVTDAKQGDKTMMDVLLPSKDAAVACQGNEKEVMADAAAAARKGMEDTRLMVARFGRAKDKKEDSIGHLDAGAVSLAAMIELIHDNMTAV